MANKTSTSISKFERGNAAETLFSANNMEYGIAVVLKFLVSSFLFSVNTSAYLCHLNFLFSKETFVF